MDDETLSDLFGALSDPRRLRALRFIARRDPSGPEPGEAVCACHVQEHLGLSQPATSYHMKVLREAGLVRGEKRGRWVHYRVSGAGLAALRRFLDRLEASAADAEEASAGAAAPAG